MILTVLSFIIVLGILIFVHEFGHYIVAKKVDIRVEEFALGFGPRLFSRKKGETVYSLRAVPLGGFCNMTGEFVPDEEMDDEERQIYEEAKERGRCFHQQPLYQRFLVVFMGPMMNFLLAFMLFIIIFVGFGLPVGDLDSTVIGGVSPGQPAAEAGLTAGDEIRSIAGRSVSSWEDIQQQIRSFAPGQEIEIELLREGEEISVVLAPEEQQGYPMIGITPETYRESIGVISAVIRGAEESWLITSMIARGFGQMLTGGLTADDIGGPVMIASMAGDAARQGLDIVMRFTAVISINLGIINLLPIPALDGGRILFMIIEGIRRKPIDPRKEGLVHLIGFVILMVLMVFIIFLDIWTLF